MLHSTRNFTISKFCQVICFLLLISCKSHAQQIPAFDDFDQFIEVVEVLKGDSPAQAFEVLQQYVGQAEQLPIEKRIVFLRVLSEVYVEQAQYQLAKDIADKGLALALELPNPSISAAELLYARGFAFESLGDYESAREDYLKGHEVADSLNNQKYTAYGLINLGALDYLTEQFDRSLIMFNDALAIANKLQDDELLGYINSELGILYSLIGQYDKSLAFHQKAYEHYVAAEKDFYVYSTLRNIAGHYIGEEKYEEAIRVLKQVLDGREKIANNEIIASAYSAMAWAQLKQKDPNPEASYQYMMIASEYISGVEQIDAPISHAIDKGYLFMELERYEEAIDAIEQATEYFKDYQDEEQKVVTTISRLNLLYLKAEIHSKMKNFRLASAVQDEFIAFMLTLPEKNNVEEIEDLRMRYESEQADLEKKLLQQQDSVNALQLAESEYRLKQRQLFVAVFSIVALILAWVLVNIIKGQRRLISAMRIDSLTGLSNRRRLMELAERHFIQAKQQKRPLSMLMVDIDNFKEINDTHGHKVGDLVLKKIASFGENLIRKNDEFGRYGGEEFIISLPNTDKEQAIAFAERFRKTVNQYGWQVDGLLEVSLSFGVVCYQDGNFENLQAMLKQADNFLYQAKKQGKNQVVCDA